MKKTLFILLITFLAFNPKCEAQAKAFILKQTGEFHLNSDTNNEFTVFGYSNADTKSKKMILFSVFTNLVENNPSKCPLGSYYNTGGMNPGDRIIFSKIVGAYVKLNFVTATKRIIPFYMKKQFIEFL